jgi:hypothetical protein
MCVVLQEYVGLVSTFKRQEALLYQFSEEKVQLAQHALELITNHQRELDAVSCVVLLYITVIWCPTAAARAAAAAAAAALLLSGG